MSTDGAPEPSVVAYLTKRFPRLSETFILDEILGLEAQGVPLRLFTIRDPHEPVVQADVARVASAVTYLRPEAAARARLRWLAATSACHARLAATRPRAYGRTLLDAVVRRRRRVALSHFVDAGRLAIELERAHAVHLHAAFAHGPAAIAHQVHLLTGLPFSFAGHAKDIYVSDPQQLARRTEAATFVLACSASARDELARVAGPASGAIRLVPHGVDVTRFRPAIDVPGERVSADGVAIDVAGERAGLRILAVGRLVEKKGYDVLLDALALLAAAAPARPFTCRIVGDGPLAGRLRARAAALGIDSLVTFAGAQPREAVAAEYAAADIFVQASVVLPDGDRDGIPNVLLEAMASGLPVVASDVAGIPEAVTDGETGLLVPGSDPAALAGAIATLLADPGLRAALGRAGRASTVDRFDRGAAVRTVAALIRQTAGPVERPASRATGSSVPPSAEVSW